MILASVFYFESIVESIFYILVALACICSGYRRADLQLYRNENLYILE